MHNEFRENNQIIQWIKKVKDKKGIQKVKNDNKMDYWDVIPH